MCSNSEHWNVVIKALGAQKAFIHSSEYVHCFMLSDHMIAQLSVAAHFPAGLDSLVCWGVSVK